MRIQFTTPLSLTGSETLLNVLRLSRHQRKTVRMVHAELWTKVRFEPTDGLAFGVTQQAMRVASIRMPR